MRKTPLHDWINSKVNPGFPEKPLTVEALAAYQLGEFRETLEYVLNKSPFYSDLLEGFDPNSFILPDDLPKLPFTTQQDIRERGPQFLCVSQDEIARVVTLFSSGTTAPSKRLYFTEHDLETTVEFFRVGMSTFVEAGRNVLILMPGERPGSVGDLLVKSLGRLNARGVPFGLVNDPAEVINCIIKEEIDCIVGIPVQVSTVIRHPDCSRIPPNTVRDVLLTADYLPAGIVREVEKAWGCRVFDHYGSTEMGLGAAVECEARSGYHLREADLYFEIIDPVTGIRLGDGETGEIVFTTLTRTGMPLVRYRTGDIGRFLEDPCPCGSMLKRMERVRGRLANRVELGDGLSLNITDLDDALFTMPGLSNYRAVLDRHHHQVVELAIVLYSATGNSELSREAEVALRKLPALCEAIRKGLLNLKIGFTSAPPPVSDIIKRRIELVE